MTQNNIKKDLEYLEYVVALVNKYVNLDTNDENFNSYEVEEIMVNSDLYINPNNKEEYFDKLQEYIERFSELPNIPFLTTEEKEKIRAACFYKSFIEVIRKMFDKDWFEHECQIRRNMDVCEKKLLKENLPTFTKEQLKEFFSILICWHAENNFFFAGENSMLLLKELHELCMEKNPSIISMASTGEEYQKFGQANPYYMFDYLDVKTIADRIIKYINRDMIWADNMAEMFIECGAKETMMYPMRCMQIQKQLGPNAHILR